MADKEIANCWRPKNIQQIGNPGEGVAIYVEEYAKSFIDDISERRCTECNIIILTGFIKKLGDEEMVFVTGAIPIGTCGDNTYVYFDNDKWRSIYDCVKRYFGDCEVVGWAVTGRSFDREDKQRLKAAHVDNFGTGTRVLYICNWIEKKEQFCLYHDGNMNSVSGYFVYYVNNTGMQEFICDYENNRVELTSDVPLELLGEASKTDSVRETLPVVQEHIRQPVATGGKLKRKVYRYSYVAGILLVISVMLFTYMVRSSSPHSGDDSMSPAGSDNVNPFLDKLVTPTIGGFIFDSENAGKNSGDTTKNQKNDIEDEDKEDEDKEGKDKEDEDKESEDAGNEDAGNEDKESGDTGNEDKESGDTENTDNGKQDKENSDKENVSDESGESSIAETLSGVRIHIVEPGDTLYAISRRYYGTDLYAEQIKGRNGIDDGDRISVGQQLILP